MRLSVLFRSGSKSHQELSFSLSIFSHVFLFFSDQQLSDTFRTTNQVVHFFLHTPGPTEKGVGQMAALAASAT